MHYFLMRHLFGIAILRANGSNLKRRTQFRNVFFRFKILVATHELHSHQLGKSINMALMHYHAPELNTDSKPYLNQLLLFKLSSNWFYLDYFSSFLSQSSIRARNNANLIIPGRLLANPIKQFLRIIKIPTLDRSADAFNRPVPPGIFF